MQLIETEKGGDDGERKWCHRDRKSVVESLTERNLEELVDEFGLGVIETGGGEDGFEG